MLSENGGIILTSRNIFIYWMILQYLTVGCHTLNRRHSHHHQQQKSVKRIVQKEIFLEKKFLHHHPNWRGENESSCAFSVNYYDDLIDSKCQSWSVLRRIGENRTEIEKKLKDLSMTGNGLFIPSCGTRPCSIIYSVKHSTRLKQGIVSGIVDNHGVILIEAEYFVAPGIPYQLGKLYSNPYSEDFSDEEGPLNVDRVDKLRRKKFVFFHEDNLDISVLNVTIMSNQGFAVVESIKLITEEQQQQQEPVHSFPSQILDKHAFETVSLDRRNDTEQPEWLEITCNYSDKFQDFWVYGCPVDIKGHKNHLRSSSGFWTTCHSQTCSFLYDSTTLSSQQPKSVTVEGFMQGGTITVSGKGHTFDEGNLRTLDTKSFQNSPVFHVTFDLSLFCNISVLQILVSSDSKSIILIDKISVHLHPNSTTMESCKETVTGPIENARAMDIQHKSLGCRTFSSWPILVTIIPVIQILLLF